MHRLMIAFMVSLSLCLVGPLAFAGESDTAKTDVVSEQSVAPVADAAHDHGDTCGGGGACCAACQIRQKYAKEKGADDDGGCPCKRAKQAREQAQAAGE